MNREIPKDGVVLLHGIFRSSWSMLPLAQVLGRNGYYTLNLDYDSRHYTLQELAARIHPDITDFCARVPGRVHFVGHSMGGLLTRVYLRLHRPERLGRVVLMGTPNKGSEVADKLQQWWLFRKLYGPAGQQLITNQKAFSGLLGTVDYELASIAGNGTIDPIGSYIIGKENDGKVSVESTKLEGMAAHKVVFCSHTFLPGNAEVKKLTLQFLKTGMMTG